jgi:hypothetical protein
MSFSVSTSTPAPEHSRVANAISSAASATGMDFGYLYSQAKIESGLDPKAQARTSSARGLYQFTRQTWLATLKNHGADHGLTWASDAITKRPDGRYQVNDPAQRDLIFGLRDQPEAASAMAAEFAADNGTFLEERLGRAAEPVDLYLAHFLGAGGAARFLSAWADDPSSPAAPFLPDAAAANRSIFYDRAGNARSLENIRAHFAAKLGGANADAIPPRFAQHIVREEQRTVTNSRSPQSLTLRAIEPMPERLSIDFARRAYQSLMPREGGRHA